MFEEPYICIMSPGSVTPTLTDSALESLQPPITGVPSAKPDKAAPSLLNSTGNVGCPNEPGQDRGIDMKVIKIFRMPALSIVIEERIVTHCIQQILGDLAGQLHDDIMMAAEDMLCFCPDLGFVFLHPADFRCDILVGNKSAKVLFYFLYFN